MKIGTTSRVSGKLGEIPVSDTNTVPGQGDAGRGGLNGSTRTNQGERHLKNHKIENLRDELEVEELKNRKNGEIVWKRC